MSDQPDYDSPWKDILERFFFDFVGFFFQMFTPVLTGTENTPFWTRNFNNLSGIRRWDAGLPINWSGYTPLTVNPS